MATKGHTWFEPENVAVAKVLLAKSLIALMPLVVFVDGVWRLAVDGDHSFGGQRRIGGGVHNSAERRGSKIVRSGRNACHGVPIPASDLDTDVEALSSKKTLVNADIGEAEIARREPVNELLLGSGRRNHRCKIKQRYEPDGHEFSHGLLPVKVDVPQPSLKRARENAPCAKVMLSAA